MALDIPLIQRALAEDALDGWLLYDFHRVEPDSPESDRLDRQHLATVVLLLQPSERDTRKLVHAIEAGVLEHLPGGTRKYAGRLQLSAGLARSCGEPRVSPWSIHHGAQFPISRGSTRGRLRRFRTAA